ncbi:Protein of unknown function [Pyronema omphalodes CBS 100304]|uniref:Uncharacterized protein n=1 Tax=Pyronema omphalodes (strain CBS 100304) TaxID=1076935 RepID=U4LHX3_PYROM|nr:Protein of unknown function [Pyronema omphalodes CBS 100304]
MCQFHTDEYIDFLSKVTTRPLLLTVTLQHGHFCIYNQQSSVTVKEIHLKTRWCVVPDTKSILQVLELALRKASCMLVVGFLWPWLPEPMLRSDRVPTTRAQHPKNPLNTKVVRVRVPGGVPHDNDSTRQRPGFIDDNYSKEIPLIGAEYNLPRDGDLQENSFFNNHGMAGINPDLYGMGLQVGSWDKFLFEQLPPQAALSIDNFDTQGNYIDPGSDQREAEPLMILHKKTTYLSTQAARSPSTRQRTRRVLKTTKFVADGVFI